MGRSVITAMTTDNASIFIDGVPSPEEMEEFNKGPFMAMRTRMGPTVYWGPFATLDEVRSWVSQQHFGVAIIKLNDPNGNPDTWW